MQINILHHWSNSQQRTISDIVPWSSQRDAGGFGTSTTSSITIIILRSPNTSNTTTRTLEKGTLFLPQVYWDAFVAPSMLVSKHVCRCEVGNTLDALTSTAVASKLRSLLGVVLVASVHEEDTTLVSYSLAMVVRLLECWNVPTPNVGCMGHDDGTAVLHNFSSPKLNVYRQASFLQDVLLMVFLSTYGMGVIPVYVSLAILKAAQSNIRISSIGPWSYLALSCSSNVRGPGSLLQARRILYLGYGTQCKSSGSFTHINLIKDAEVLRTHAVTMNSKMTTLDAMLIAVKVLVNV
ncbi:hypothetical protein KCV07_g461, partial [Aureobasidium melanogenum]